MKRIASVRESQPLYLGVGLCNTSRRSKSHLHPISARKLSLGLEVRYPGGGGR